MKKKKTFFDGVDASIDKQRYISCFARKRKKSSINEMLREKILQDFFKKACEIQRRKYGDITIKRNRKAQGRKRFKNLSKE